MKSVLILGAGRSSSSLISYLLQYSEGGKCSVTVGDSSLDAARERIGGSIGKAIAFDITDVESSRWIISKADVVVSLLPAHFHPSVARICLDTHKHMLTASYVSDEMTAFDKEARSKSLLLLNECGLDPGIDHMSAMQVIDRIKAGGGRLFSFESFTGGLIAPETAPDNPWRYKFTWNARNVVMAGQTTARFLENQQYKYIPYQQLFKRTTPIVVPGNNYEGYANRDSIRYLETYKLSELKTMLRGTLRHRGFCSAWNIFVQLGCCDDGYEMENVPDLTHRAFINSFLDSNSDLTVEEKIGKCFSLPANSPEIQKLRWSGFFDEVKVGLNHGTPAQILEHILNKKWKLEESDKDMVVMWHRFGFETNGVRKEIQASMVVEGTNAVQTAMAKTVGLPLAIATRLLIEGKIQQRGVIIPTEKEIYEPVINELKSLGIELVESELIKSNDPR